MGDFFMCTSIFIKNKCSYFARNMDLNYNINELALIIPRNYKISFKSIDSIDKHFAIIGIGVIKSNYPLLAEGANEKGLAIAALNFPNNATYYLKDDNKLNLSPFELMLYLLAKCENITQVKLALNTINIVDIPFSKELVNTPLHFMVSDKNSSVVIETLKDKMHIYDNPYNILTNNPPFIYHKENVNNYMSLNTSSATNNFDQKLNLTNYSYGMGLLGLPGDYSSTSRFIKALFIKNNMQLFENEFDNIKAIFNCLESVKMIKGIVNTNIGIEYTHYTSCYNLDKGYLYYKTYDNMCINVIELYNEDINSNELFHYNLINSFNICRQNKNR